MNKESFVIGREDAYGDWGAEYIFTGTYDGVVAETKKLNVEAGSRKYSWHGPLEWIKGESLEDANG